MIAEKMIGKALGKGAFEVAKEVKDAEKIFGKEQVVNCTLGTMYREDETFTVLSTVDKLFREIPAVDIFGYAAGVSGSAEYKAAVKRNIFGKYESSFDKSYIGITATPGGTGAIVNTIRGYMDAGQKILLPCYMWESYVNIASSNQLGYETYSLFEGEKFNIKDFSEKLLNMAKEQHKVLAIINDPCQNPTGYSLTFEEWQEVIEVLKEAAKYGDVILLNDTAYIDYDFRGQDEARRYMTLFNGLPENILIMIAYSMSKSYTCYGVRVGAQVAVSSSKAVIDEFDTNSSFLCRTTWSNISRGGMKLLADIYGDENILKQVEAERNEARGILEKRAEIFLKEAEKVNLPLCPFRSGFFMTIPVSENRDEIIADLKEKKIFVLPTVGGIRVAFCSVPCKKLETLPKEIADSMKKFSK